MRRTEESISNHLKEILPRIHAILVEIDRIEEAGLQDRTKPYPPASETEIAKREKALGFEFPSSYRAFLRIHNGWRGFPFDVAIFGVSGPGYDRPAKDLRAYLKIFERTFKRQGARHAEELKRKEKDNPDLIYLPHHPAVATDFNGIFTVFDRNRRSAEGEYELADVSSGQYVEARYPSFLGLVDDVYRRARASLLELGGDPGVIEARAAKLAGNERKSAKPHAKES